MLSHIVLVFGMGAAMFLASSARYAAAQSSGNAPRQQPSLVTATYSVADLVVPVDLEPSEKKHVAGTREEELMKTIRTTVAPNSWSENGGPATMRYHSIGMALVVQQSPAEHGKIRDLLRNLRRLQDIEVAVEIRLVNLPDGRMNAFDFYQQGRDLSDIQVFQFLEAAQGDRRLSVMQAPKLTTFNAQKAKISLIEDHYYVTGLKPVGEKENLVAQPQIEKVALGLSFSVRPVVSSDLRYVTMNLGVYLANLEGPVPSISVDAPAADGKRTQIPLHLPKVSKIELEKTLKTADGATTIVPLGRKTTENRAEISAPILSKIPYLSRLYKNMAYVPEATELFLFVTPRIIIREQEEEISQK